MKRTLLASPRFLSAAEFRFRDDSRAF